jgi:hypothetical protein
MITTTRIALYNLLFEEKQQTITETSLGRIMTRHWDNGFIVISANRSAEAELGRTPTPEEEAEQHKRNVENTASLKALIKAAGFGYIPVLGGFKEKVIDPDTGKEHLVDTPKPELSFIVPAGGDGITSTESLKALGQELAKKFNQDSFLYKPSTLESEKAFYITKDGNVDMEFSGEVVPNDLEQAYYTQLIKKPGRFTLT